MWDLDYIWQVEEKELMRRTERLTRLDSEECRWCCWMKRLDAMEKGSVGSDR